MSNHSHLICDFCCIENEPVTTAFPAQDFESKGLPITDDVYLYLKSDGFWAACAPCAEMIDKGDRRGLAERSALSYEDKATVIPHEELVAAIRGIHDDFWAHRQGPGVEAL